ncbi:hypothetical protein GA0074692_0962 [Micromonospora pallida]|uniref:HAD-superfamily hydrolase, subfamily IIB n=1 Tax=Micromonospora pallida TaxID=145854 RepID=A0A1C6RU80_9ACTN|nr:hypothetical protein GA0074692_0962 [Micromonospora pallida]
MRWYRAVAFDLDGTLTTGGSPSAAVLDRIAALRDDGVRMLLVTGRNLAHLEADFPGLANRFDLVVAENGCVLRTDDAVRHLVDPVEPALLERLSSAGVAVGRGEVLLGAGADAYDAVVEAVGFLGLDVQVVRNRDELMLLPAGISKGTGLCAALAELDISPHNSMAFGDAENDHAMFAAAELGVAVANAVDSLRRCADLVLTTPNGAGVAELLASDVLSGRQRLHSDRRHVVLGTDAADRPVRLPAAQTNLLITGAGGSARSYLTRLVVEQLVAQRYSVLMLAPEGRQVPLDTLPGLTVLGGAQLPDPAELPRLHGIDRSVLLDLSGLGTTAREAYSQAMWQQLLAHRAATGTPHWFVIDVGQAGTCRIPWPKGTGAEQWGLCVVSGQPDQLDADLLARMEWRVALSQDGGQEAVLTGPNILPQSITLGRRLTTPKETMVGASQGREDRSV